MIGDVDMLNRRKSKLSFKSPKARTRHSWFDQLKGFSLTVLMILVFMSQAEIGVYAEESSADLPEEQVTVWKGEEVEEAVEDETPSPTPHLRNGTMSDNIESNGGGVDVTPLKAEKLEAGKIKYSFQVSLQGIQSSDHIQTANTFHSAVPQVVGKIRFTQIGTYDKVAYWRDLAENDEQFLYDSEFIKKYARDIEMPLEVYRYHMAEDEEAYYELLDEWEERIRRTNVLSPDYEDALLPGSLAWYHEGEALKAEGINHVPGGVFEMPDDYLEEMGLSGDWRVRNYVITANNSFFPFDLRVEYIVTEDQAKKTSILPLYMGLAWRSFGENIPPASEEAGGQSLYDFGKEGLEKCMTYVSQPETITEDQLSEDGLLGSGVGLTKRTDHWAIIGEDVEEDEKRFRYAEIFNLSANPSVLYYVSADEDYRDIAAVMYKAQEPEETAPTPEPEEKPTPSPEEEPKEEPQVEDPTPEPNEEEEELTTTEEVVEKVKPAPKKPALPKQEQFESKPAVVAQQLPQAGEVTSPWLIAVAIVYLAAGLFMTQCVFE